ncbi:Protein CLEC16A [Galemys pyrenaicus]|uniref:Protein CLEC16A n=1 Tax=Galemys pyrenaicus TaxID=202257 RepID=A0A8J6AL05_GALPY|nr:Protein CLEC16A [Galemys pyrenaicus]
MFGRSRSWVGGGHGKSSRNIHSLDHLNMALTDPLPKLQVVVEEDRRYLYHVLTKNTTVTEQNRNLLVETIRSITEILIWGDQNDSSVFDFFLEKNMFVFFLNILRQKSGRYVCVQLLQTLNILFENISHETSLYYLLSNNYVNSIIVHKFDFSDEEIMAYYISFLKTLSLKLNNHTVHFFYNEHTNDFALYTEAIKFFNHPESMVRIAVRTITLNVYKVDNQAMLHYIRDKTAVPYFSNLVWFIGSHVIELDNCVQTDEEHRNRGKLSDLVAEHLDHLHYLNDILIINCEFLNDVLTDHLLNRLFLPLYVCSLENQDEGGERPKISLPVSLYLLSQGHSGAQDVCSSLVASDGGGRPPRPLTFMQIPFVLSHQVFLIIHHAPLVNSLAEVILNGDLSEVYAKTEQDVQRSSAKPSIRCFIKPTETLERSLEMNKQKGKRRVQKRPNYKNVGEEEDEEKGPTEDAQEDAEKAKGTEGGSKGIKTSGENEEIEMVIMERNKLPEPAAGPSVQEQNTTDEEKSAAATGVDRTPWNRPFLEMVYHALDSPDDDYHALFVLCLLYAMSHNKGKPPVSHSLAVAPCAMGKEEATFLQDSLSRSEGSSEEGDQMEPAMGTQALASVRVSLVLLDPVEPTAAPLLMVCVWRGPNPEFGAKNLRCGCWARHMSLLGPAEVPTSLFSRQSRLSCDEEPAGRLAKTGLHSSQSLPFAAVRVPTVGGDSQHELTCSPQAPTGTLRELGLHAALLTACLLSVPGMDPEKLERIQLPVPGAAEKTTYNHLLAERLIRIMNNAAQPDGKIRLATLELSCLLLKQQVVSSSGCIIKDVHLACLEGAREESVHLVRHFYKGEEIFLDMFEDEYRSMTMKPMNVEYLMMDASILLPPTGTPLTGIDFVKRLPCGDVEKTRRAIRVFFMLRSLSLQLRGEPETQLPLTREEDLIKTDDVLDLSESPTPRPAAPCAHLRMPTLECSQHRR